jgi:hypothetical protein
MAEAQKCTTEVCLHAWRDACEDKIKAVVPKEYQQFPVASIEKEYQKDLARIKQAEASTPPPVAKQSPVDFAAIGALISPIVMAEAQKCTTEVCLRAWRDAQEDKIKTVVPKEYQQFPLASIEKEYENDLARIKQAEASTPPPAERQSPVDFAAIGALISPTVMAEAQKCTTEVCLRAWRDAHEKKIKAVVPKEFQQFPLASIEKEYEKNLARIKRVEASTLMTTSPAATKAPAPSPARAPLAPVPAIQMAVADVAVAPFPVKTWSHSLIGILFLLSLGLIIGGICLYANVFKVRFRQAENLRDDCDFIELGK